MFNKIKNKIKALRYGDLIFTFPNGKKLYTIKDNSLFNLPAKVYTNLEENNNYIAFLGVSKTNIEASNKMIERLCDSGINGENNYDKIKEVLGIKNRLLSEYDRATQLLMESTFDAFFFFEDENPFETDFDKRAEFLELKKYYLENYPYFKSFFFQLLKKRHKNLQDIWNESINFALAQVTFGQIIKELKLELTQTDTADNKQN